MRIHLGYYIGLLTTFLWFPSRIHPNLSAGPTKMRYTRLLALAILLLSILVACTRDREVADPGAATTGADVTPALAAGTAGEPEVATAEPTDEVADAPAGAPTEPAQLEPTETPSPDDGPGTFQYTVVEGDTIASIADEYGTDISTLRQMNFLVDDNILVGQVLRVALGNGFTPAGAPTPTPEPFFYIVEPGDSLTGIAVQFDVAPAELIAANNIVDQNNIPVGQSLLIPGVASTTSDTSNESSIDSDGRTPFAEGEGQAVHIVQPGEALGAIAELYGVDVGKLSDANNITNRDLLRVGQRLFIPGLTPREAAAATQIVHVVKSGEGLLRIAEFYGVTGADIVALNQLQNSDLIYPGQELLIPDQ